VGLDIKIVWDDERVDGDPHCSLMDWGRQGGNELFESGDV